MTVETFKSIFFQTAKKHDFEEISNGLCKESSETIFVLDLQKSNASNIYQLNLKIYIQGIFGNTYTKTKELVIDTGNIFRREPMEYGYLFDLDDLITDSEKEIKLNDFFRDFIIPFSKKALSKEGIKELYLSKEINILPVVKKELGLE